MSAAETPKYQTRIRRLTILTVIVREFSDGELKITSQQQLFTPKNHKMILMGAHARLEPTFKSAGRKVRAELKRIDEDSFMHRQQAK